MKYITVQGDMWDSIAYNLYGDETKMDVLIAENPELAYVYIFSAGVELQVPDADVNSSASGLPLWKNSSG